MSTDILKIKLGRRICVGNLVVVIRYFLCLSLSKYEVRERAAQGYILQPRWGLKDRTERYKSILRYCCHHIKEIWATKNGNH